MSVNLYNIPADQLMRLFIDHWPASVRPTLIFADPPFNIGHPYAGYSDRLPEGDFDLMLMEFVALAARAIKPDGVICLHGPDRLCETYLDAARRAGLHRTAWVNLGYAFGQCREDNFVDARTHCLIYSKSKGSHQWHPDEILVPSTRLLSGDKRTSQSSRGGYRVPGTIWGLESDPETGCVLDPLKAEDCWGRVQGNNRERRHERPNQLPVKYLARLIKAYTSPGDFVCDPFMGTGTTVVVADLLGREGIGGDLDPHSIQCVERRLADESHMSLCRERVAELVTV